SRNVLGSFENHFVDNNDGTVTDMATGLMWQKSGSSGSLDNRGAKEYVKRLKRKRFAGHSNWRMPTVEELSSLIKKAKKNGVHIAPIFDNNRIRCWTVDPCEPNYSFLSGAWIVDFKQGKVSISMWSYDTQIATHNINKMNYVKAVRSLR
ncbi:MAG: Lcl C-terminal domain-containing protein, partial [Planctomycetota bacterium]